MSTAMLFPREIDPLIWRRLTRATEQAWWKSQNFAFAFEYVIHQRRKEFESDHGSNVYFIWDSNWQAVKIGIANDPADRAASLQTAHYRDLILYAAAPATQKLERFLHHVLRRDRLRGEWFYPSRRLLTLAELFRSVEEQCVALLEVVDGLSPSDTVATLCFLIDMGEADLRRQAA